ncbi:MAG TPA: ATP-binding protein [Chryseosolibacter sp.]|nr:ATP-binding protein [Chryseosolibacter sp.]
MKAKPLHFAALSFLLLASGIIAAWISFTQDSPNAMAEHVAEHLAGELETIETELSPLRNKSFDINGALNTETTYPFFVYDASRLRYWSDNTFIPPAQVLSDSFQIKLLRIGREAYLLKKDFLDDKHYVISVVTLLREYTISNDYLSLEWNEDIFPSPSFTVLEPNASLGIPVCIGDNCVFRISFLAADFPARPHLRVVSIILLSLSLVAILLLVYFLLPDFRKRSAEAGFVFLLLALIALRWLMTFFRFPAALISSDFFDPLIFASSSINASLGDLFLNVLFILMACLYIFRNFYRFRILKLRNEPVLSWAISIFSGLCILFAWLFPYVVIQTLYNNSAITLAISQSLQFDALRMVALLAVMLSGVSAFLFSHPFISLLSADKNRVRVIVSFFVAIAVFILVHELSEQTYLSSLICAAISFFTVHFLRLHKNLRRLSYGTFAYLFVSIFFLSASGAYAIRDFTQKEKVENQFRFASTFLIDRDIFAEYLLNEASEDIASDAFIQTRLMSPFLGKEPVRQKIRQLFLPSYFNKYDIQIFIFNSFGAPIDNQVDVNFEQLVRGYQAEPFRTEYQNIFFVTNPETDITQKYVMVVPVERSATVHGYIVVDLSLKKIIPENVYPELLVDRTFQQFYQTQDLNYAVFSNKDIVFTSGEYNYERFFDRTWLGSTSLYTKGISFNGYDHIAQEDQSGRIAVVSSKEIPLVYKVANFSFLFVLGLLIILLMIFIQGIFNYFAGRRLFFSARIQLYLNLAFFLPLIAVSITTLGLTSRSSQQQLNTEYLNKSRVFGQQLTEYLNQYVSDVDESRATLTNQLADLAKLSNMDANVYNVQGQLLASSQPLIFESNLISRYINSRAFFRILGGENLLIEAEKVGKLRYFVAYTAIKSPQTGDLIGILGVPFFQSAYLLERVQTVILSNILNIFAVVFIVLLVLSYFVSEWLTFPLRFITQSLRKTSLTKMNKPLTWTASDEIGLMVKEYNSMLFKLSESKVELEQTQREKAWREIAQQVAHEIKNPLTPMKLTLQQLERALKEGNGSVEKTRKAVATLLDQVDTLNEIASSFSGFAKMPEPVIVRLELVSLIRRVIDLHSPTGEIAFRSTVREVGVLGDEQLLSRTFSNLILNGLQAGNPGQHIKVSVTIQREKDKVRVQFHDNGRGIDPEIADRIFLPHFSTKKSGSGLGLAISRQAIHQMNGTIYFETKLNKGTTFTVELPVAE